MARVGMAAGVVLRANSSFASVLGPSGLVSGGNGWGLRVPLSWALALPSATKPIAHNASAAHRAKPGQSRRRGDLMLDDTMIFEGMAKRPDERLIRVQSRPS